MSPTGQSDHADGGDGRTSRADDDVVIERAVRYDANVDDLDPRLWPHVIEQVLAAGAHDAWVTPILMKKGRPAFTFSALCSEHGAATVRRAIFRETSTIGLRATTIDKHMLAREQSEVSVGGRGIGVKSASLDGERINRSVEWDDVIAAAVALGLSAKEVLAAATAAAYDLP